MQKHREILFNLLCKRGDKSLNEIGGRGWFARSSWKQILFDEWHREMICCTLALKKTELLNERRNFKSTWCKILKDPTILKDTKIFHCFGCNKYHNKQQPGAAEEMESFSSNISSTSLWSKKKKEEKRRRKREKKKIAEKKRTQHKLITRLSRIMVR